MNGVLKIRYPECKWKRKKGTCKCEFECKGKGVCEK